MKIAIIGYGKMGHIIERIAQERGHEITCRIESEIESQKSKAEGVLGPDGFDSPGFASSDIAIEFTTPSTAKDNILRAWAHNIPVVSGTTGWDWQILAKESAETGKGLIWSSNYSLGVNILFAMNKRLAALLAPYRDYTPSITEVHHIHKLDKPSGTAKTLAEELTMHNAQCTMRDVPIDSIREGEVPGIHTVTWDSPVDTLTLSHSAKSRDGFALGAVLAAEWLKGKHGFHTMQEVLGL